MGPVYSADGSFMGLLTFFYSRDWYLDYSFSSEYTKYTLIVLDQIISCTGS